MTKPFRIRFFGSQSHNLKSKTCTEPFDSAQDKLRRSFQKRPRRPKLVVIVAIVVTLACRGARLRRSRAEKSSASVSSIQALLPVGAVLAAFRAGAAQARVD